ncbi:MAG: AAA family ATPase, partial [Candidatus Nanohaloarchaea archaeon]|nr:AAA family ATPase [Candidatus Nanohaloarchaea archaeon]
ERDKFITSYAMFASCQKALYELDVPTGEGSLQTGIGDLITMDPDGEQNRQIQAFHGFMRNYSQLLDQASSGEEAVSITTDYLNSVAQECYQNMQEHPEYVEAVEDMDLEVDGFTLSGLEGQGRVESLSFGNVEWEDVVGNNEVKDTLETTIDMLFDYDPDEGNDIAEMVSLPNSVLIYGDPGTGKTLTLKAAGNHAADRAEDLGKDLVIEQLDSDVKSKYHGETSERLKETFRKVTDPDNIGLLYMEDVESLFPSRDELEGEPEDKDAFRELLNQIQGVETNEDMGNYLIVGTTNYPELLDDAFEERFNMDVNAPGPEEPEEYSEIFEIHLEEFMDDGLIDVESYGAIGERAEEAELSGREIQNITKGLTVERSRNIEFTEEFYEMDREEKQELIRSQMDPITEEEVLDEIDAHIEEKERQAERSEEAEIERRADRKVKSKKAEQRAEEQLEEEGIDIDL